MHIKVIGQGPDLIMLHGWSMNSAVWHDLAEGLAKNFTLHLVDLPGHGQSDWQEGDLELDVLIENLAVALPKSAYWLGWSLGGLISLAFAEKYPQQVEKIVLMSATPCFVKNEGWSSAMEADIFNAFADNLESNQAETLQRFLLLQARGSAHSKDILRQLGEQLAVEQPPVEQALTAGLNVLINTDMREALSTLQCPVKMILGERDTLIPKEMLLAATRLQTKIQTTLLAGAGHAPFISQPNECQNEIEHFLND